MTGSDALSAALALRLNLQVRVASLAIVGEEMDGPLARWLDAAPLPAAGPDGRDVHFEVRLQSDLSRLCFSMQGPRSRVLPRIEAYFDAGADRGDSDDSHHVDEDAGRPPSTAIPSFGPATTPGAALAALTETLQPVDVGSFLAIDRAGLCTGWALPCRLPLAGVIAELSATERAQLSRLPPDVTCEGLRRCVGQGGWSEIELGVGTAAAGAALFEALGGGPLPVPVRALAEVGRPPRVTLRPGSDPRLAFAIDGAGFAALDAVADALGIAVDPRLERLLLGFGADALSGIEYVLVDGVAVLAAVAAPSGAEVPAGPRSIN